MDSSWFVRPETIRLPLSDGQSIVVKKRLSAGEFRAHLRRGSRLDADGVRQVDILEHSLSLVIAYLVDWSLDVDIRGVAEANLVAALDTLEPARFVELKQAIAAHEASMTAEREAEKNGTGGEKNTAAISPSPYAAAGVSSGSVPSMSTTTPNS